MIDSASAPVSTTQRAQGQSATPLLSVRNLVKEFVIGGGLGRRKKAIVHAVSDISFDIAEGEFVGLVGESGCGKSTVARCITGLITPTSGEILFEGDHIEGLSEAEFLPYRKHIQIVFQNPLSSLHPRMTISRILHEPLKMFGANASAADKRVLEVLDAVNLGQELLTAYPHQLSGGQRQRVGIARALALKPKLIVLDESIAALDVSIQAGVLNLLQDLRKRENLTYLFISHDLSVIQHVCDRVVVMYLGCIMEDAPMAEIAAGPMHPYTKALLDAVPQPDPRRERMRQRIALQGDIPSPTQPPSGCRFHPRCPYATEQCSGLRPPLEQRGPEHRVACYHPLPPAS